MPQQELILESERRTPHGLTFLKMLCVPIVVYATGKGRSWDVGRNLRTYVLHQITLRINNRSHGRFAAVSGATKRDRTMTWW